MQNSVERWDLVPHRLALTQITAAGEGSSSSKHRTLESRHLRALRQQATLPWGISKGFSVGLQVKEKWIWHYWYPSVAHGTKPGLLTGAAGVKIIFHKSPNQNET